MVIVQNIHEQKDTPCHKYLQSYKPFASLTFSMFKFIHEDDQIYHGGGGEEKKRCVYHQLDVLTVCSVIYMQGPGDWKCSCQAF